MVSSSCYIEIIVSISSGFLMPLPLSFFFCTGVSSFFSIGFPMPWPLSFFFCRLETLGRDCSSTTSLEVYDLVKGFLTLMLVVEGDEEKCIFFPFFVVGLVEEGASSNSGGGGGEKSLSGE
jgi:hypothetical protein